MSGYDHEAVCHRDLAKRDFATDRQRFAFIIKQCRPDIAVVVYLADVCRVGWFKEPGAGLLAGVVGCHGYCTLPGRRAFLDAGMGNLGGPDE
jgi:hypothetical protein